MSRYLELLSDQREVEAAELVREQARQRGYTIGPVYHGTTHEWTVFDLSRANDENDFGRGIYFTNVMEDAVRNYQGEGPDLRNRIERRVEHLVSLGESESKARKQATKELKGKVDRLLTCYLKMTRPFIVGGRDETRLNLVVDEEGNESGDLLPFLNRLREECEHYGARWSHVMGCFADLELSDVRATSLLQALRECAELDYAEGDEGVMMRNEMIRRSIAAAGFDGIMDRTVSARWPWAKLPKTAVHYIVFRPEQAKLADVATIVNGRMVPLEKRFDERSPDIRNPRMNPLTRKVRQSLATVLEPDDRVLNYDTAKGEELYRLYDVVVTDQPLNGEALTEIEGLLDDNGVLVILSGEMPPGLEDHFKRAVRHRGMLLVQHPKNPEEARINAEKQRREG